MPEEEGRNPATSAWKTRSMAGAASRQEEDCTGDLALPKSVEQDLEPRLKRLHTRAQFVHGKRRFDN
jgi:hypothetical protein